MVDLPSKVLDSYKRVFDHLKSEYGHLDHAATVRSQLSNLVQDPKTETMSQRAAKVRRLVNRAYIGRSQEEKEALAVEAFLKGYQNERHAYFVLSARDPKTLSDAPDQLAKVEQDWKIRNALKWIDLLNLKQSQRNNLVYLKI